MRDLIKLWHGLCIVITLTIVLCSCDAGEVSKNDSSAIGTDKVADVNVAQSSTSDVAEQELKKYKVVPNDVLQVKVEGEPDFSQDHLWVYPEPEGLIKYPPLGDVRVVGLTLSEIEKKLTELLGNYVTNPKVTVSVKEHHPELESTR